MSLRRKLLISFGTLALLALVIAGMTLWTIAQWRRSEEGLQAHYLRSLMAQRVRAAVFRAFKEVPDAVNSNDTDARREFAAYLKPARRDLEEWSDLATTDEERQQAGRVRAALDDLVRDAEQVFDLVEAGRRREAAALMEGRLENRHFAAFEQRTDEAVESDRRYRQVVRAEVANTRRTAQIVLAVAAFGTLSLVLLLAAFLASDLFAPLRAVEEALDGAAHGDRERRLDEDRSDEIGAVNRAFNRMAGALERRERVLAAASGEDGDGAVPDVPSRLTLHRLAAQLRARVSQLGEAGDQRELVRELDLLSHAVARVTEFGMPLDLNLARADLRTLLYEVLLRFHEELARRAVSFELSVAPEVDTALVDRLKLREALAELVRNALAALPERGGHVGLRAVVAGDELVIEVADDGAGMEAPPVDRAFDGGRMPGKPGVGLALTRAVVEQHGGDLAMESEPGKGTFVTLRLPLRA